jgi:subtilisin family serine protease
MVSSEFQPLVEDLASASGVRTSRQDKGRLTELALRVVTQRQATKSRSLIAGLKSPEERRYIVAPRLYQQTAGPSVQNSLRNIETTLRSKIVRSTQEAGSKVLQLTSLEAALVKERYPALLVEPDIQHSLARTPLYASIEPVQVPASGAKTLEIEILGNGSPLPLARVLLLVDAQQKIGYEGSTDETGILRVSIRSSDTKLSRIVVIPVSGYWSRAWTDVDVSSRLTLSVDPLRVGGFDWGLTATEAMARGQRGGQGIKVGVIDSGIGPHGSLRVAGGKNLIEGEAADAWQDLEGHGTHCAGVIAALALSASTWGYAPNVDIYGLRVFGGADGGGYSSAIAEAIEWAIDAECDVLSMSFTSAAPSSFLRSKIEKATDRGILCVAAAGNDGGAVGYPAKFRSVLGVSAIGKKDTFPSDSIHGEAASGIWSQDRKYFFAGFSNRGDEIDLCAPGVAITSTLPNDRFGAWDGTSMACPHVAGIAALALEASPEVRTAPRDAERMGLLSDKVLGLCNDLGMPSSHQGSGLPRLTALFQA